MVYIQCIYIYMYIYIYTRVYILPQYINTKLNNPISPITASWFSSRFFYPAATFHPRSARRWRDWWLRRWETWHVAILRDENGGDSAVKHEEMMWVHRIVFLKYVYGWMKWLSVSTRLYDKREEMEWKQQTGERLTRKETLIISLHQFTIIWVGL